MKTQQTTSGRWSVQYGDPVPYTSPLKANEQYPSVVHYQCSKTGSQVGVVYRTQGGSWYLSSSYLGWNTTEVFSKIEGFLLLNNLHKQHQLR